jgi:hypothetical protein
MYANTLRVTGFAIAAVPAFLLFASGVPLGVPVLIMLVLMATFFLLPTMYFRRTLRVPAGMAALFLGLNAPIATFVLLTPREQPRSDGVYDTDMFRVPLLHIFGARDQPMGSEVFDTLDVVTGVSLAVVFVWGLGLFVAAVHIKRRRA